MIYTLTTEQLRNQRATLEAGIETDRRILATTPKGTRRWLNAKADIAFCIRKLDTLQENDR